MDNNRPGLIYINKSKPSAKNFGLFSGIFLAKWINDGAHEYSLPQELEKAREAGYFSSNIYNMYLCESIFTGQAYEEPVVSSVT